MRDSDVKVWAGNTCCIIMGACSSSEVFNKTGNSVELKLKTTAVIFPSSFE